MNRVFATRFGGNGWEAHRQAPMLARTQGVQCYRMQATPAPTWGLGLEITVVMNSCLAAQAGCNPSIPIRRAERKEAAIGPGFLDSAGK